MDKNIYDDLLNKTKKEIDSLSLNKNSDKKDLLTFFENVIKDFESKTDVKIDDCLFSGLERIIKEQNIEEKYNKTNEILPIYLGNEILKDKEKPFIYNYHTELDRKSNMAIVGFVGSGKYFLLRSIFFNIIMTNTPNEVGFVILDHKIQDLKETDYNAPHTLKIFNNIENYTKNICDLINICIERIKYFKSLEIYSENNNKLITVPRLIISINELPLYKDIDQNCLLKLIYLLSQIAYEANVTLIFANSNINSTVSSNKNLLNILDTCSMKIGMKMKNNKNADILFSKTNNVDFESLKTGEFYFESNNSNELIKLSTQKLVCDTNNINYFDDLIKLISQCWFYIFEK